MFPSVRSDDPLFTLEGGAPAITSTAVEPITGVAERSIIFGGGSTPMLVVGGKQIGEAVGTIIRVAVAQLRLPDDFHLRQQYNPDDDKMFPGLMESIRQTNVNIEPLLCEVTQETATVDGEPLPVLIVRSGERRYWALTKLHLPYAQVRLLPQDSQEGATLLLSLIQNEMREPLSILDRCDIVGMLVNDYHMRQHTVAAYTGYSQPYVSRLNMGYRQPTIIRTYLANATISLETVEALNKRFKGDDDVRELVARYIVQESLKNEPAIDLLNEIAPPQGLAPVARLEIGTGNEVMKIPLRNELPASRSGTLQLMGDRPYWKRGSPLRAIPSRIVEQHHSVVVQGTVAAPMVALPSLHFTQLLELLEHERTDMVDVAALEEAYLSDLEAIREALDAMRRATK